MEKPLKIPKFKNENVEKIRIRMPLYMVSQIKERANAIDIPYQALMKKYIADGIKRDSQLAKK